METLLYDVFTNTVTDIAMDIASLITSHPNQKLYWLKDDQSESACRVQVRPKIKVDTYDDIDVDNTKDILQCTSIVNELYKNYDESELQFNIVNIMEGHENINASKYEILIDWLVLVNTTFKYKHETLFMTVFIINRYLAIVKNLPILKLQLVGVSSLLIASKYEEIYPKEIWKLVSICDGVYKKNDIINMEYSILKELKFNIYNPNSLTFACRYFKAAHANRLFVNMGFYLLIRVLQDASFVNYLPSLVAASVMYIVRDKCNRLTTWSNTLIHYTNYTYDDMKQCIDDIKTIVSTKNKCTGAYNVFKQSKHDTVSLMFD